MSEVWAAFTRAERGRVLVLCNTARLRNEGHEREYRAMWDTGCTRTCVSSRVVRDLGLEPSGESLFRTAAGTHHVKDYAVSMTLQNKVDIENWPVSCFDNDDQDFDVLVGTDIMTLGEFAISFKDGVTSFTFRVPAQGHADFTGEADAGRLAGPGGA